MSCSGCRVLRKGCSETCMLRPCLQWIPSPEAQGHATVFVAKFFGRAGLMAFISAVPPNQRPALFQSLLYEACGRSVNPVYGAVGLLWSGNWHICQSAVDRVLQGVPLQPHSVGISATTPNLDHKHATMPSTKRPAPPLSNHQAPTKKHAFSLPSVELHLAPPQYGEEEEEESTPSPSSSSTPSPTPSPTNSQGSITSLDPNDPTMCCLYQEEERKPLDLLH